jgi:hypothetical protein
MILRDPRAGTRDSEIKATVFFVFSLPDLEEAKDWMKRHKIPARAWDDKMKRVRIYGRSTHVLQDLHKATMTQVREYQEVLGIDKKRS